MPTSTHLVVLIHGLFGSTQNLEVLAETLIDVGTQPAGPASRSTAGAEQTQTSRHMSTGSLTAESDSTHTPLRRRRAPAARTAAQEMENGGEEKTARAGDADAPGVKAAASEVAVYSCNSFGWGHTWDGVDINAERAADEVRTEISRLEEDGKRIEWISIIGYSLGGLIARYLIAALSAGDADFFARHKPAAFATVATPHLGVLKYGTKTNTIIHTIGRRLFSRTGQQLYCLDRDSNGRCLLETMADPNSTFIQTLQRFRKVFIFVNGCHDLTVPFPTAAISDTDPFSDYETHPFPLEVDENNIVRSWTPPGHVASNGPTRDRLDRRDETDHSSMATAREDEEITFRDGGIDITVTVARSTPENSRTNVAKARSNTGKERRPRYPPVLFARYPYTYLPILFLPLIFPLWLCFVTCFMIYQSLKSARRYRLHTTSRAITERTPLLAGVSASSASHAVTPASALAHLSHLSTAPRSGSSTPAPPSGTSTPSFHALAMSPSVSLDTANALLVKPASEGVSTPRTATKGSDTAMAVSSRPAAPLMLTDRQKGMIYDINSALEGKVERVIAWFPLEFNSHATLIVRNPKMFANHNRARGILRLLSQKVLDAATVQITPKYDPWVDPPAVCSTLLLNRHAPETNMPRAADFGI